MVEDSKAFWNKDKEHTKWKKPASITTHLTSLSQLKKLQPQNNGELLGTIH